MMIEWNPSKLKRFKKAYKQAIAYDVKEDTFIFEGNEFVVGYAKYLIQYLEGVFNGKTNA